MKTFFDTIFGVGGVVTIIALQVSLFAAWVYAIVHTAQNDMIAMLIIDILIPPVGVIHGLIIFFGG